MAKFFLTRTLTGWMPTDQDAIDASRKHKPGDVCRAEIVRARNYKHHCLFMCLLEITFENQDKYTDFRMFRRAVALEAGHVDVVITLNGETQFVPLSYSYDELPDESEFDEAFGKALTVCANRIQMKSEMLATEISRYASEKYRVAA